MVPKGWSIESLGNVTEKVGSGVTPRGGSNSYKLSGIPLIRSQNVLWGKLDLSDVAYIDELQHNKMKGSFVYKNDVLLNITGASIGRAAVSDIDEANVNQHVCIIRSDELDSEYLKSFLLSFQGQKQIEQCQAGGNRQGLNFEQIKSFKIPFPPLPEQQKIAKILSTWDKAIGTTERLIDNSTQQKKALMQQLLTGKKRLLDESGQRFAGEFNQYRLGELVDIDKKSLGKNTPKNYEFEYISLSDVSTGTISKSLERHIFSSAPSRARRIVRENDILLATVRPNLKGFAKAKEEHDGFIASTGFAVLSAKKDMSNDYVYHYLFSHHLTGQINALVVGSNYPAINSSDVGSLKILCPPLKEQQKIATVLTNADKEIELLEQQLADLQQEKKALMQVLLTGKKRVVVDGEA